MMVVVRAASLTLGQRALALAHTPAPQSVSGKVAGAVPRQVAGRGLHHIASSAAAPKARNTACVIRVCCCSCLMTHLFSSSTALSVGLVSYATAHTPKYRI